MDRFVLREPRTGAEHPQGNQIAYLANASGSNMIPPETIYFSGPFASEFLNAQPNIGGQHNMAAQHMMASHQNMGAQNNMSAQHNMASHQNMGAQNNMSAQHNMASHQNMGAQNNMSAQHNMASHQNMGAQNNMSAQHNMGTLQNMVPQHNIGPQGIPQNITALRNSNAQLNRSTQHSMGVRHNMNPQTQSFEQNLMAGQSGIDPRYLAGYSDNSAQFIVNGQQIQRNATPINCSFGSDYQNRSFNAIDRNKQKSFAPQIFNAESPRVAAMPKPQPQPMVARYSNNENTLKNDSVPQPKKPNELDLLRNDIQNQIVTRADKLKALHRTGPRAFSGPVEKVLKWHKSLQDIGVLIFYEIVAKCVGVRAGDSGSKVMVVRDDSGPAMQVVYYEIDFLLPELKPPCTVRVVGRMIAGTCRLQTFSVRPATGDDLATLPRRAAAAAHYVVQLCKEVVGRMMAGTCRLQAFSVRLATGDDLATLPRRAAAAAHYVAKLCKEYGHNPTQHT